MTVVYPSWVWLTEPEHNFLTASYSLDLSTEHSVTRRSLLQSPWFQRLFDDRFQLAGDRNQVAQYANDRRGQMIATSVGATTMGRGCDTAILDDPTVGSAERAVAAAKVTAAEAALANAAAGIQLHGGMGYTWEVDAHLHLKRAYVLEQSFGAREESDALDDLVVHRENRLEELPVDEPTVNLARAGADLAVMRAKAGIHATIVARVDAGVDLRLRGDDGQAVSSNSSRPISQRRISDVPAPIS